MYGCYKKYKKGFNQNFFSISCLWLVLMVFQVILGVLYLKPDIRSHYRRTNNDKYKNADTKQIIVIKFHEGVVFKVTVWMCDFVTKRSINAIGPTPRPITFRY